ncbi:hypothetical protein HWV62_5666 [Athelia sp. TMB]|nr:hypothetical protein HWV62_5666 [Athelia sp. TMB]
MADSTITVGTVTTAPSARGKKQAQSGDTINNLVSTDLGRRLPGIRAEGDINRRRALEGRRELRRRARRGPPAARLDVYTVGLAELAREKLGEGHVYFEHAQDRKTRLLRGDANVTLVFRPTERVVTKYVCKGPVSMGWEMKQTQEKIATNPTKVYWSVHTTNGLLKGMLDEKKRREME